MSGSADLLGVAWAGLTARGADLLIMLGPIVGVAAMVGAVGLTESAKGDLKQKLSELGTNLDRRQGGGLVRRAEPDVARRRRRPGGACGLGHRRVGGCRDQRCRRAPLSGRSRLLPSVPRSRARGGHEPPRRARGPGRATGRGSGRRPRLQTRSAVIGRQLAQQYGYLRGETRTIRLNGSTSASSACSATSSSIPGSATRCSSRESAESRLRHRRGSDEGLHPQRRRHDAADRDAIPTAITRRHRRGVDERAERRVEGERPGRQDAAADGVVRGLAALGSRRPRHRERDVDLGDPAIVGDRHPPRAGRTLAARSARSSSSRRSSSACSVGCSARHSAC